MPPPNDVRKASAKKTPEKKTDLGPQLLRKRSQDFASKIQGWNQAGGGVAQRQDEVVVVEDSVQAPEKPGKRQSKDEDLVQIVVETESIVPDAVTTHEDIARSTSPATPVTPTFNAQSKSTPVTSGTKKAGRDVDLGRGAWVRRKSKPQVEAPELKQVATPKKRVVSDGHWRRDRQQKEEAQIKEKDVTPKPLIIRKSVVNVGMKIPPSHQDFQESEPEHEPVRLRPSRHAHSRSPSGSEATPDYETSGTKVYIKRRARSKVWDEDGKPNEKSDTSRTASSSVDKPSSATSITTPNASPPHGGPLRPKSAPRPGAGKAREPASMDRPKSARQLREMNSAERAPGATSGRAFTKVDQLNDVLRPSKSAEAYARQITEHIKKPVVPPPGPIPPRVYGNRIEGWLANMQDDPFTEKRRSSMTPEPLEIHKKSKRVERDVHADDGKVGPASGEYRHRSRFQSESLDSDAYDEQKDSSPTTLKRRGARHGSVSPVKGRSNRATTLGNEVLMSGALPSRAETKTRKTSAAERTQKFRIPSGGRPLSEIPSITSQRYHGPRHGMVHSLDAPSATKESVLSRVSDGDQPIRKKSGIKRRPTTKHADLMSVLSLDKDDSHTIISARSLRASRRKAEPTTIARVMNDLSTDELRYQRELRTLVEGVIPVLLQHAVAGSKAPPSSRVFSRPTNDTKPIYDMGVALERLKTKHKWIPMHDPNELLKWAKEAAKVYADYLKVWRLGYKDIIVNLAPAENATTAGGAPEWGEGLPRNKDGDLLDSSGERVDVAHLLKRPLVRLKYLAKTLKSINELQSSADAETAAGTYQDLIAEAKQRANNEKARLEDEAASSIDATRARDPRSLAPITGVTIDPTRSVRARDYFDMELVHSSGQQLDCKIEVIYRDDAPSRGKAGDVLFCEISPTGRWLLFPPIPCSLVTARKGDRHSELVVMVRGFLSNAQQWREIMSLQADDDSTSAEWLQMLGSSPMPPKLSKKSSFNTRQQAPSHRPRLSEHTPEEVPADSGKKYWDASLREIEVPIGEKARSTSRVWDGSEVNSVHNSQAGPQQRSNPSRYRHRSNTSTGDVKNATRRDRDAVTQPAYFYDIPEHDRPSVHSRSKSDWTASSVTSDSQSYSVWMPSTDSRLSEDFSDEEDDRPTRQPSRPKMQRRTSSVPSLDMPTIPKLRQSSQPREAPARSESPSSDRDLLPSQKRRVEAERLVQTPSSAPSKLQQRRLSKSERRPDDRAAEDGPSSSFKTRPLSLGLTSKILPSLTPAFLKKNRRPSSPLKHEYEPSTASDSLSDSDLSELSDAESHTSESTVEEVVEEQISTIGDLKAFQEYAVRGIRRSPPPASQPTLPEPSLAPSESASQAPYRMVPPTAAVPAKTVANIFTWSERGSWDSLHIEECQIFVTPGLIEAFDLTQANSVSCDAEGEGSTPSSKGVRPLVALELTPLVPLRRGTAVDISIRSPPTTNSVIRMGNNIMFRSRSAEECERLYALINRARIDNPTYIALQKARGPAPQSNWAEVMDKRNAARTASGGSRSWWNLGSKRSNSYRSKGSRTLSIAATESSVGTMNTAFSALRSFSGGSRFFNIAKSTITSREGTRSSNSESLSSQTMTPVQFDPQMGTPVGITNAKVRLYIRESAGKWRDMGAARLTVMIPPRQDPTASVYSAAPNVQKRVLVYGKSKGELLLDVTLGESAFERIARTGIAVSVYEEADHISATGGVLVAKTTVYMVQMKSERDAAYTFSQVGKLRY